MSQRAVVAQLVERVLGKDEVTSSILVNGSIKIRFWFLVGVDLAAASIVVVALPCRRGSVTGNRIPSRERKRPVILTGHSLNAQ